jgi:hypothetical protein
MSVELAVVIPDSHIPYEDKRAYRLVKKVMHYYRKVIKEITILGDFGDFYAVTGHGKSADMQHTLLSEVESINKYLDYFEKTFPRAKKVFIEGNHEYRLARYIEKNCPALFGVTDTPYLLKLFERHNFKYIPYGPNQSHQILGSYLVARHEPLASSAKATASKALCSLVYGHIHRIEESHLVGLDGTNHVCFSVGWLGDKRKDKVFNYVKGHHQWQLGFGLVWVDRETNYFYHQKVHILDNYTCVIDGKVFKA